MGDRHHESYLGDGLYVYHDGWHVWLYTSDGSSETNRVALEPPVLARFREWMETVGRKGSSNDA